MGFGAIITAGENNKLLQDDLVGCITEVRVEQSLDDPARYAIRLEDDISSGDFEVMNAPELQPGAMIAVAVQVEDQIRCLVRGPITEAHSSFQLGGPGTSYEVHGEDRRIELDRLWFQRRWSGRASEAAETTLSSKFKTNIQKTNIVYGSRRSQGREVLETLNQSSTDAYFISCIARDNNLHFWLEYDCRSAGDSLIIQETANLQPSPPRPDSSTTSSADALELAPTTPVKLRVNVAPSAGDAGPNVSAFSLRMDAERPNRFSGTAIDDRDVRIHSTQVTDPQPTVLKNGQRFPAVEEARDMRVTTAGNQDELQVKAESSLTEAGWFVSATASTTAHRLNGIVLPHDVIEVEGLAGIHNGAYQVRSVIHVINAADHFMDIELRRNTVGKR